MKNKNKKQTNPQNRVSSSPYICLSISHMMTTKTFQYIVERTNHSINGIRTIGKSAKAKKKKPPKTYSIKLLGVNVEDFEDRERFLKSIIAKANQVKNLCNNQHHKQSENPSDQLGKNTRKI